MLRIFHYYRARYGRDEKVAVGAVGRLKSQRDLFLVARNARHESAKAAAIDKLHDPYLLFSLTRGGNPPETRLKAAGKLTGRATREAYRDLALAGGEGLGETYRELALTVEGPAQAGGGRKGILPTLVWDGAITGQEFLEEVGDPLGAAATETYLSLATKSMGHGSGLGLAALARIPDGDLASLKSVAMEAASSEIRAKAMDRIGDLDALTEIVVAMGPCDNVNLAKAMDKISGQSRLMRIFKAASLRGAKLLAAERMDDISGILSDLLAWEKEEWNLADRLRLAEIIGDGDLIEEAIMNLALTGSYRSLDEASESLAGVSQKARLIRVLREANDWYASMAAGDELDSETLVGCLHSEDATLATSAAYVLAKKDHARLERAFKDFTGHPYVREYICSKLGHSFGKNCVCLDCGIQEHTFDKWADGGTERRWAEKGESFTCQRCGAVKTWFIERKTGPCDRCSATGMIDMYSSQSGVGGGWEETCTDCGGSGEKTTEKTLFRVVPKGENP
ncbi:MAG: hypothetical protein LBF58_10005 [Deltaproteobacteria bacterium]|jgi:hypothetical protein|nr:hypothetical protein [Deltaproteobacteria bacterium]